MLYICPHCEKVGKSQDCLCSVRVRKAYSISWVKKMEERASSYKTRLKWGLLKSKLVKAIQEDQKDELRFT